MLLCLSFVQSQWLPGAHLGSLSSDVEFLSWWAEDLSSSFTLARRRVLLKKYWVTSVPRSAAVPVFPCALLGCGTEVNNSEATRKPNQTSLESWADVRGFPGLVMAKPPCVLPLCFRRIVRINLETKESCCARPGVVCAALLKDSGLQSPQNHPALSCLPGL